MGIVAVTEHCRGINVLALLLHLWSSGKASFCDSGLPHYLLSIGTCSLENAVLQSISREQGSALMTLIREISPK